MPYVSFDPHTREIQSANSGPPESLLSGLKPGLEVGEVPDIQFDGAIKNYVFFPDESQAADSTFPRGKVQRKPQEEWDLEAEEREQILKRNLLRFHQLNIAEVHKVEVYLMIPSRFSFWDGSDYTYAFNFENNPLQVRLIRQSPTPLNVQFEFGGYTIPFHKTLIRFDLSGCENFITTALHAKLRDMDEIGRRLFTSQVLKEECLGFALRATNFLIERYRVAYDDPAERPIGPRDVLSGAIVIELNDGLRQAQHSGISLSGDITFRRRSSHRVAVGQDQERAEAQARNMQYFAQ